jgi:hypothetical protein
VFSHKPQYRNNGYVWMVDEDKCLTEWKWKFGLCREFHL